MSERLHQGVYWLEVICLGLPTLVLGGGLALIGAFIGLMSSEAGGRNEDVALLFIWSGAGFMGLVAWVYLSVVYLWGGVAALAKRCWLWWVALVAGMIAASMMLYLLEDIDDLFDFLEVFFIGPALLIPSLHLLWLKINSLFSGSNFPLKTVK